MKTILSPITTYICIYTVAFLFATSLALAHGDEALEHTHEEDTHKTEVLYVMFALSGFLLGVGVGYGIAGTSKSKNAKKDLLNNTQL